MCGSCPNFYIAYDCNNMFEPAVFYGDIPAVLPFSFITNDGTCWYSNGEITSGPATITVSQGVKGNCRDCMGLGFYIAIACDGISPNEVILIPNIDAGAIIRASNGNCYTTSIIPTSGPATISYNARYEDCFSCLSAG